MSKLTDIKYRIDQLDGGSFQNLCDEYLQCKGYGTPYPFGMKEGTNKTTKGNPDTYYLSKSGQYIFVMYTTQKNSFIQKAIIDIEKCFDPEKTGLLPEKVSEVILCHTCGNISPGDDQMLRQLCKSHSAKLTLISLDELGFDIYLKHPRLARDHLGISVDTGQITSVQDYVRFHDANKMSAPLGTTFLSRKDEFESAKEKLEQSDVLIISGPAGVGKTRLAIELCNNLAEQEKCEALCIKSNNLGLYDDLATVIEQEKGYVIFVDDANELTELHLVLDYLPKTKIGQRHIHKIILTVRDYARRQVVEQVLEVEKPEILKIGPLEDSDIEKLMEVSFEIKNPLYLERIKNIAEGNARLAMLAGKLAAETETLDSIQDASGLYEHYYCKQIGIIRESETSIISAGILAFFQALYLVNLDRLEPIFSTVGLTADQFISDIRQLHILELADLCHDKAAKIADQSFSNYLLKYVFVDKKLIPLDQMIEVSFSINQARTVSACNILLNVFSDKALQEYVEEQVGIAWDRLKKNSKDFLPFFKAFHMIRPTETLLLIKNWIDQEDSRPFDIDSIASKKNHCDKTIMDDIINILCSFKIHLQFSEAVKLLLLHYRKRPELFEQIYSAFASEFGVNRDAPRYGYYTQKIVVEQLCAELTANPCKEIALLFTRVAEEYLKLEYSKTEIGSQNRFVFYTMALTMDENVLKYRNMLLQQLLLMYNNGQCRSEIENLLKNYCQPSDVEIDCEIVKQEFELVLRFFALFSPDSLYHCVIAEKIRNAAQRMGCDCEDKLQSFFESPKYVIYNALRKDPMELLDSNYEKRKKLLKERTQKLIQNYDASDFRFLFQVCTECLNSVDPEARLLSFGIENAISAAASNQDLYIEVVKAYIEADTPYNIHANTIIENLFCMLSSEGLWELISSYDFAQKDTWLWYFYAELPESQISQMWESKLLGYLEYPSQDICSSPYRPLDQIQKYEKVDADIIFKASKIIAAHYEDSPFVFSLYFFFLVNPISEAKALKTIKQYESDIPLLEDIYLKYLLYSNNEDYEVKLLSEILKKDPQFLYTYLNCAANHVRPFSGLRDSWMNRLLFVWDSDDYINYMDRILDYLFENVENYLRAYRSPIEHLLICKSNEIEIANRQKQWVQHTIERYFSDTQKMCHFFSNIAEHATRLMPCALEKLLSLNHDYSLFEQLPLEPLTIGGFGGMLPYIERRIEYLSSILPLLSGVDFLRHRELIEKRIENWKRTIEREEIAELMRSIE